MNKFAEIFLIIMGAVVTVSATILAGYFTGGIKTIELIFVGMSVMRIIIIIFKKKKTR